jgi:hypothetical protein
VSKLVGIVSVIANFWMASVAGAALLPSVAEDTSVVMSVQSVKSFIAEIQSANCTETAEVGEVLEGKRPIESLSGAALLAYHDVADMQLHLASAHTAQVLNGSKYDRAVFSTIYGNLGFADGAFQAKKFVCAINGDSGIRNGFEK